MAMFRICVSYICIPYSNVIHKVLGCQWFTHGHFPAHWTFKHPNDKQPTKHAYLTHSTFSIVGTHERSIYNKHVSYLHHTTLSHYPWQRVTVNVWGVSISDDDIMELELEMAPDKQVSFARLQHICLQIMSKMSPNLISSLVHFWDEWFWYWIHVFFGGRGLIWEFSR